MSTPGKALETSDYIRDYDLRVRVMRKVYTILDSGATCPECGWKPGRTIIVPEWAAHVLEHMVGLEKPNVIDEAQDVTVPAPPPKPRGPQI